jgi:hypothetical protein
MATKKTPQIRNASVGIRDSTIGTEGGDIVGRNKVYIENYTQVTVLLQQPPKLDSTTVRDDAPSPTCPYPGLTNFNPEDAALFFGREAVVQRLEVSVTTRSLTILVGASGSGKSSVVLAGLAPRLHAHGLWRFTHFRIGIEPSKSPFLALARALVPLYVESETDTDRLKNTKQLAQSLQNGELQLSDVLADCRRRNNNKRILLIADQFEEVFALTDTEMGRFITVLMEAFNTKRSIETPAISIILTLRADFVSQACRHQHFVDALQSCSEFLGPMSGEELHAAIIRPAEIANITFEPGLVQTLIDDVGRKPGRLPLLQFALREMWAQQPSRQMTRVGYDSIGRINGALTRRAQKIYDTRTTGGQDEHEVALFRRLFTRLVSLGEGEEDTRRIVGREELGEEAWRLAQHLAGENNRLVVTNALLHGNETVEIAHEALIRNWPTLIDWLSSDREFQSWLRSLRLRLDERRSFPTDDGTLLRGGPLTQAERWLSKRADDISSEEKLFIQAGVRLREAEKSRDEEALADQHTKQKQDAKSRASARRRFALSIAASIMIAGIAGCLVWFFVQERRQDYKRIIEAELGETSNDYVWRITRLLSAYSAVARPPWTWLISKANGVNELRVLMSKTPEFSGRFQFATMDTTGTKLATLQEYDKIIDRVDIELMDLQNSPLQLTTQAVRAPRVEARVGIASLGPLKKVVSLRNRVLRMEGERDSIYLGKSFATLRSPAVEVSGGGIRVRELSLPADVDKQGTVRLVQYKIHKSIRKKKVFMSSEYELDEMLVDGYMPAFSAVSAYYANVHEGTVIVSTFDGKRKFVAWVQALAQETGVPPSITFSQDGNSAVIKTDSKIVVLTIDTQGMVEFDVPPDSRNYILSRSPGTRPLLAAVQVRRAWYFGWLEPGGVRVVKATIDDAGSRVVSSELLLSGLEGAGTALVFSTDGRWITFIQEDLQGLMDVRSWSLDSERLAGLSDQELVAAACGMVQRGVCN